MSVIEALRECEIFSRLSDVELQRLVPSAVEEQYEAGATIFQEGDNAEALLAIREGRVAIQMTLPRVVGQANRRITVDVMGKNDVVGWSAIVEPHKYNFTVVCLQRVKALSISGSKLRRALDDDQRIGYLVLTGLIRVVASRLDETRRVLISERQAPGSV